jgi:hypothetical protein
MPRKWWREDADNGFDLAFQPEVSTLYHGQQKAKRPSKDFGGSLLHKSNWYHLVNAYSQKQLTCETDKLPALSAIAQEIQRLTNYTYVAGLWKEDIIHGLLWRATYTRPSMDNATETNNLSLIQNSNTPSWSWAAYSGLVETLEWRRPDCDFQELAVVEVATVKLSNELYPTGNVRGGTLVMRGLCQQFLFNSRNTIELSEAKGRRLDPSTVVAPLPLNGTAQLESNFDLVTEQNADGPGFCLLMAKHDDYYAKFGGGRHKVHIDAQVYCLILRLSHIGSEQYKRVGVGVIRGNNVLNESTGWAERTFTLL